MTTCWLLVMFGCVVKAGYTRATRSTPVTPSLTIITTPLHTHTHPAHRGRFIALDVARGLTYLHARRIAHFDLKSPNILLSSNHTAKIADMGMSRTLAKDVVTKSTTIGTLAWAAPELLINTRISSAVDVYSFGVVLWELVTGLVPMRGRMRSLRWGGVLC